MTLKELKVVLNNTDPSLDDYQVECVSDIKVLDDGAFGRMDFPIDHVLVFPDEKSINLFSDDDLKKWEELVRNYTQDD
jgi:hypothetical protein